MTAAGILPFTIGESPTANHETFYIDDKFKPFSWLMFSAGMRPTRFSEETFPPVPSNRPSPSPPLASLRSHRNHS